MGAPPKSMNRASVNARTAMGSPESQHQKLTRPERVARDLNLTHNRIERALLVRWLDREQCIFGKLYVRVKRFGGGLERRAGAKCLSYDQARLEAFGFDLRQLERAVMHKGRVALLLLLRQRHPGLDAEKALSTTPPVRARALGMHDAAAGPHPVDRPWFDGPFGAQTVAVQDLTLKQVGDSCQVDVRMGTHIDSLVCQELGRAHLIEKDERSNHLPFEGRQRASDLHLAKVHRARNNQRLDGVRAGAVTGNGIRAGTPAHDIVLRCMLSAFSSLGQQCDVTRARVV